MAINIGSEQVLVIEIHNGEIFSIQDERRSVYENTKGKFIKTKKQGYGQVWLDADNRAIIAYHNWRPTAISNDDVQKALHVMFSDYNLTGFIK